MLRVIGDVHGQIGAEDLCTPRGRPYLEIIAGADYSIQVGDMGDGETYDQLRAQVDVGRHRFLPGNHDHYDRLPPHSLGDFGWLAWGGVEFFFVRGAASTDREKLVRLGQDIGKRLWFAEEELTEAQMQTAQDEYERTRPSIVISHDAPTEIARLAWKHAWQFGSPNPEAQFRASRTNAFHTRLVEGHAPRLWLFGHHHHDFKYRDGETLFVCVGELSYVDIDAAGNVR